jgi:hypothetical protein
MNPALLDLLVKMEPLLLRVLEGLATQLIEHIAHAQNVQATAIPSVVQQPPTPVSAQSNIAGQGTLNK